MGERKQKKGDMRKSKDYGPGPRGLVPYVVGAHVLSQDGVGIR